VNGGEEDAEEEEEGEGGGGGEGRRLTCGGSRCCWRWRRRGKKTDLRWLTVLLAVEEEREED